jgi:predicted thioesterase
MVAITSGLLGEAKLIVEETHTAKHLGSGGVEVLATPVRMQRAPR